MKAIEIWEALVPYLENKSFNLTLTTRHFMMPIESIKAEGTHLIIGIRGMHLCYDLISEFEDTIEVTELQARLGPKPGTVGFPALPHEAYSL